MKNRFHLFFCFPEKPSRFFILRVSVLLLIFLLQLSTTTKAQNNTDHETENRLKKAAEAYFDQGDFTDAYSLYSQLLSLYSHNPNYNYRFGACMLFAKADKAKALRYLQYGAKQPGVENLAYYYLGRGLHLNYKFDEAIQYYQKFEQTASSGDLKKYPVNYLIEMCRNGKTLLAISQELDVLRKRQLNLSDFYRAYNMHGNGGSLISEPDEFKSKVDEDKKVVNLMYLTPDKTKGFFSSYGNDASNGKDIYMITRKDGGGWSTPVNVGNVINTPYDEDYPVYDAPRDILYFSSKGHNSMGGYDIFSSAYDDAANTWSAPVNLDFPINTPDDDILLVPDTSGQTAFFASTRSSPQGKIDVYKIALHLHPPESEVIAGTVHQAGNNAPEFSIITVRDSATNKIVAIDTTSSQDGKYSFNLPKGGKYTFTVEDSTHKGVSQSVYLAQAEAGLGIVQNIQFDPSGSLQIQSTAVASTKDSASQLALQYIQNQAQMNVNVDTTSLKTLLAQNNSTNTNTTSQNISSASTNNNGTTQNGGNTNSANSSSGTNGNSISGIIQNNTTSAAAGSPDTANAFQLEQDKQQLNDKATKAADYASNQMETAQQLQEQINNPSKYGGNSDSINKWTAESKTATEKGMEAYQLAAAEKSDAAGKQSKINKIENTNSSGGTQTNNQTPNNSSGDASTAKVSPGDLIRQQAEQVKEDSTQLANSNTEETAEIKGLQAQAQEFTKEASQTSDPQQKAALQQQADDLLKSKEQKQEELNENTAQLQQLHNEYNWLNKEATTADGAATNTANSATATPSPALQNEINAYAISNGADSTDVATSNNNQDGGTTGNSDNRSTSNNTTSTNTSRHSKHSHIKKNGNQTGNIAATNPQTNNVTNTNSGSQNTQVTSTDNGTSSNNGNSTTNNNSQTNNNNNGNQNTQVISTDNGASSNNGNNNTNNNSGNQNTQVTNADNGAPSNNGTNNTNNTAQTNNSNNGNQNTQVTNTDNGASSNNGNNNAANNTEGNNNNSGNQNTQVTTTDNGTSQTNGNNNTNNTALTNNNSNGNQNTQVINTDNGTLPDNGNNTTSNASTTNTSGNTQINAKPDTTIYYTTTNNITLDAIVNIFPTTNTQNNNSAPNLANNQGPSTLSTVQYNDTVSVVLEQKSQVYYTVATSLTDTVQKYKNDAQTEPDKIKATLLYRKADSINGIIFQLKYKGDAIATEANTHQYTTNADLIANIAAQSSSTRPDKISAAQSALKDADDSYRKSLAEKDSANTTPILASKLNYIESAKQDLATAILKQENAVYFYYQADSIQSASNNTASTSGSASSFNYSDFLKTQGKITPNSSNNSVVNNSNTGIIENLHPNNITPTNNTTNQNSGNVQPSNTNSSPQNTSSSNTNNSNTNNPDNNIGATNNTVSFNNSESAASSETATVFKEINTSSAYSNTKPIPKDSPLPTGLIFGIQIGAFRNAIPQNLFKGFEPIIGLTAPEGYVRYIAGVFRTLAPAKTALTKIRGVGYPQAFIVAYYNGKRITIQEALAKLSGATLPVIAQENPETNTEPIRPQTNNTQITQVTPQPIDANPSGDGGHQVLVLIGNTITPSKRTVIDDKRKNSNTIKDTVPPEASSISTIKGLVYTVQVGSFATRKGFTRLRKIKNLYSWTDPTGIIKYNSGTYNNVADARTARDIIVANTEVKDAFVTAYYNGKRITPAQASQILSTGNFTVAPSNNAINKKDSTIPPPNNLIQVDSSAFVNASQVKVIFTVRAASFNGQLSFDTVSKLRADTIDTITPYKEENNATSYYAGKYPDYAEAYVLQQNLIKAGFPKATIVSYYHGKQIPVQEAQAITNK